MKYNRESEKRYSDFIENLNDIAYETDKFGNITYCNKITEEISGLSKDRIIGYNFLNLFSEEDGKLALENFTKTLNGESPTFELTFINSGKTCQFSNKPLKNDKEEIIGVYGIGRDITEHKKAEHELKIYQDHLQELIDEKTKELKTSEEKYRIITETANDLIRIINDKFEIEYINELTHLRILGYSKDEMIGKFAGTFMHPDEYEQIGKYAFEFHKYGSSSREGRFKHKNGTWIWMDIKSKSYLDNEGNWKLLTISREITDRKKAEQQLKESEERFKALFKGGPVPTYTWQEVGNDFKLINYNNAAEKTTLGDVKKYLGFKASEMYKDRPDIIKDIHRCFEKKINITREVKYYINILKEEKDLLAKYSYIPPDLVLVHTEDITERINAEQKLRESEENSRNMINNLDVAFYKGEFKGKLLMHNSALNKILGIDPSKNLIGSEASKFFNNPEDQEIYYERLTNQGFIKNFISQIKKVNGEKINIEINAHMIYDGEGKPKEIEGTVMDITEKYRLEQKLKESEEKYRNLFEKSPYAIALLDLNGKILDCNSREEEILGYKKNELIGADFRNLHAIPQKYIPVVMNGFKTLIKGEIPEPQEIQFYKKNGDPIWINLQASLLKLEDEILIQLITQDITNLKESEYKLRDSEIKYRHLFESSPYVIGLLDLNGTIIDLNNAVNDILSLESREDIIGKNFREIFLETSKNKHLFPIFEKISKKIMKGDTKDSFEFPVNRKIGDVIWLSLRCSLIKIEKETLIQILVQDITERKSFEQTLKRSEQKFRFLFENTPSSILLINP
ncbi:MAG: PAS domain S-box protein, partial [Promethearchaeota archaeon]